MKGKVIGMDSPGTRPAISVILPTYYRNASLQEAIESVLNQEYDPIELIVVDDSGEGHAEPILDRYDDVTGIRMEENCGWGPAITTGVRASTGQFIQLLDDDDLLLKNKILKTASVLRSDPKTGVAYCGVVYDHGCVTPDSEMRGDVTERMLLFDNDPCYTCSMLIEREILERVLPLPVLPAANDYNLMIELTQETRFDYVDECLVRKRDSGDGIWREMDRARGMRAVVSRHNDLYDEFPPRVRRTVLAEANKIEGRSLLEDHLWSVPAVLCFARSLYLADGNTASRLMELVASLFGRPGLVGARRLRDLLFGPPAVRS